MRQALVLAALVLVTLGGCTDPTSGAAGDAQGTSTTRQMVPTTSATYEPLPPPAAPRTANGTRPPLVPGPPAPEVDTVKVGDEAVRIRLDNPVSPRLYQFRIQAGSPWSFTMGLDNAQAGSPGGSAAYGTMVLPDELADLPPSCGRAEEVRMFHPHLGANPVELPAGMFRVLVWNAAINGQFDVLINPGADGPGPSVNVTTVAAPFVAMEPATASGEVPVDTTLELTDVAGYTFVMAQLHPAPLSQGGWNQRIDMRSESVCSHDEQSGSTQVGLTQDVPRPLAAVAGGNGTSVHLQFEASRGAADGAPFVGSPPRYSLTAVAVRHEPRGVV